MVSNGVIGAICSWQKNAFNRRFIDLLTFKRCFYTCSKVIRIATVVESYFLFANCVNAHLLSDFLRRYFGLIRRVTKSVTICPPPSSSSTRFRTRNRTQMVKNLNYLGLPKFNYSLTVKLRVFVNWFSPETTLEVHLKLLQNSFSNRRRSLKGGNV